MRLDLDHGGEDWDDLGVPAGDVSPDDDRPLVFLCHSSGDKERVRALYRRLTADGVRCWFDEEDLSPGQDWDLEITRAIKRSRFVLACLSVDSVTKAGFVHKELRRALDVADEQPEGSTFIIPLRLEKCELPTRLSPLHTLDLFENGSHGHDRLLSVVGPSPFRVASTLRRSYISRQTNGKYGASVLLVCAASLIPTASALSDELQDIVDEKVFIGLRPAGPLIYDSEIVYRSDFGVAVMHASAAEGDSSLPQQPELSRLADLLGFLSSKSGRNAVVQVGEGDLLFPGGAAAGLTTAPRFNIGPGDSIGNVARKIGSTFGILRQTRDF